MPDDHFERLILRQTDDPALLARTADVLGRRCHVTAFVAIVPSVAPPAKWVRAKQKGPVALAAWAARYCDDPATLRAVYATPGLRKTVLDALCESPHLPDDLRTTISTEHRAHPEVRRRLGASLSLDAQVTAFAAGDTASGVTRLLIDHQVRAGRLGAGQVTTLLETYLAADDWERCLAISNYPQREDVGRRVLDALLAHFDWGFAAISMLAGDPALAASHRLVRCLDDGRRPPIDLAIGLLRADLPLTDAEFAQVASRAYEGRSAAPVLSAAQTRDRCELALDLLPPGLSVQDLPALVTRTVLTDGSDPLLTRLVSRADPRLFPLVLTGAWTLDFLNGPLGIDADGATRFLPPPSLVDAMVRRIISPEDRENTVRMLYEALRSGTVRGAYRDMLLDKIPGLAHRVVTWSDDRPAHSPLCGADEWIWVRLTVATDRIDVALDQLRNQPTRSLDEVCAVAANLGRVRAS